VIMANTRFSDIVLDDVNLSMAAKGVFVTVGFLGNGCELANLQAHTRDTLENLQSALDELERYGYIGLNEGAVFIRPAPEFGLSG
jgi:hypothetical protein